MTKKLKDNIFTYGVILLVVAVGIAVGTYAYYQTTVTGTIGGTVLAWDCSLGSSGVQKATFANMYPGTNGTITFNVKSNITSTFYVYVTGFNSMNSGTRSNLKLYKTRSGSAGAYTFSNAITSTSVTTNTANAAASGTVSSNGGTGSVTIYYNWPYGTSEDYIADAPSFTYTIVCVQN